MKSVVGEMTSSVIGSCGTNKELMKSVVGRMTSFVIDSYGTREVSRGSEEVIRYEVSRGRDDVIRDWFIRD
jgi:hypothetical protein